jgi:hypothetical protein
VMEEGEACPLLVLPLHLLQLGDRLLTSVPFLLHPHQTHHLAAAVIADSKAGSDRFCYCQYHSVVLTCVGPCVHTVLIVLLREICYMWGQRFLQVTGTTSPQMTKFCMVVPYVCESVLENLLHVTPWCLEFWDGSQIFGKFVDSCVRELINDLCGRKNVCQFTVIWNTIFT